MNIKLKTTKIGFANQYQFLHNEVHFWSQFVFFVSYTETNWYIYINLVLKWRQQIFILIAILAKGDWHSWHTFNSL